MCVCVCACIIHYPCRSSACTIKVGGERLTNYILCYLTHDSYNLANTQFQPSCITQIPEEEYLDFFLKRFDYSGKGSLTYAEFAKGLQEAGLNSTFREKKGLTEKVRKVVKKLVKLALPDKPKKMSSSTISRSSRRYRPFDPTQNYRVIYMC